MCFPVDRVPVFLTFHNICPLEKKTLDLPELAETYTVNTTKRSKQTLRLTFLFVFIPNLISFSFFFLNNNNNLFLCFVFKQSFQLIINWWTTALLRNAALWDVCSGLSGAGADLPSSSLSGSVPSLAAGLLFGGLAGFGAYQISNDPRNVWVSLGKYYPLHHPYVFFSPCI